MSLDLRYYSFYTHSDCLGLDLKYASPMFWSVCLDDCVISWWDKNSNILYLK